MGSMKIKAMVVGIMMLTLSAGGLLPAAEYPIKPVQLLVGFAPGGPADLSTRALAEAAKPFFPKPFTVVCKPGGGGVLATNEVIKAAPDGYTLGNVIIASLTSSPHLETNLPYKGPDDIVPIISTINAQNIFAVKADAPWKTMKEVIDYARANPGKLRIAHSGIGAPTHLHYLSLKLLGVPMTEVPFAGSIPASTALMGGHIEGMVMNISPTLPFVRAGRMRYLAAFTEERVLDVPELKDVPTFKELGYNVLTEGSSYMIAAPKGTSQKILDMLYDALLKAEKSDIFQKFRKDSVLAVEMKGPAELKKDMEKSYAFHGDFIKKTGLRLSPQK